MIFIDRKEAGKLLAKKLKKYKDSKTIVLGIPRGGVVIASEISKALRIPLNIIVVRKISHPFHPEFGLGAVAEVNIEIFDEKTMKDLGVSKKDLKEVVKKEKLELKRRVKVYRVGKKFPDLSGSTVILVDDGLATGVTAKAAIKAVRKNNPGRIIFATPVSSDDIAREVEAMVDNFLCLQVVSDLSAISLWYEEFYPVEDSEVLEILDSSS